MGGRAARRDHFRMAPIHFIRLATLCVAIMCGAGSAQLAAIGEHAPGGASAVFPLER
jgi:hypothetical protein